MIRQIIKIDKEKCNGCKLCVEACHEGAIGIVDGKAALLRDDYCDGLGDCLPACPTGAISFERREAEAYDAEAVQIRLKSKNKDNTAAQMSCTDSQINNWPIQIKLAPPKAHYFDDAKLIVAADCTAFAYGGFHNDYLKGHVLLIGCPKLDNADYSQKLTDILTENNIKSVKVLRMEVPCCGGLEFAVKQALVNSGKMIPWQVITISTDGSVVAD